MATQCNKPVKITVPMKWKNVQSCRDMVTCTWAVYLPDAAAAADAAPPAAAALPLEAPEAAAASAAALYTTIGAEVEAGTVYTTFCGGGVEAGT